MKFSIITVVKNDQNNITKTILSVLSQNYKNFEYIILDGYSHDNTFKMIKKFSKNKKLKIIRVRDKNLYDGINKAIKKSKGKYIGLMHSGDFFSSNKILSKIDNKIKNFDFLSSNLIFYKDKKLSRFWTYNKVNLDKYNFFKIAHPTSFIRRDILIKNKYNLNYKISSDTDLLIRLKAKKIKYIHFNMITYFMSAGGLSTSYFQLINKVFEDIKIYFNHFGILFLFFYLQKIIYKFFKFIFQKKDKLKNLEKKFNKTLIKLEKQKALFK